MKIPEFQASRKLDGLYDIDCMVATLAHSTVPVLAKSHQKRFEVDETFEVALLGRNGGEMTSWHREMLQRLFEQEELIEGIRQGIAQLEASEDFAGYDCAEEMDLAAGLLPWVYVNAVKIDGLREMVYVSMNTMMDMHLQEHGMEVIWEQGEWRYEVDENDYPVDIEGDERYAQR